jgi:hypothetical protein
MIHNWRPATGNDVSNIVKMAQDHFQREIDLIFTPDPVAYSRNITLAVVNQFYLPTTELLSVANSDSGELLAYTWVKSFERAPWSDDRMVNVRMAHLALDLSARKRIELISDMMTLWENFARFSQCPIICSTTMRNDQHAFLKLHKRMGYDVRGSYAYKRLNFEAQQNGQTTNY